MERLSGLDASFLYAETNTMLMHVAFIAICDPSVNHDGYDFRDIYSLIDAKTQEEPAFRRRLVAVPFNLHHPVWIDDPEFRITDHIHQYTLPRHSDMSDLGHKIGRIMSRPLNRDRPLWEAWVIEGLPGGRFALVLKIHHAMVDGVSGTELFRNLFSTHQGFQAPRVYNRSPGERLPTRTELVTHALHSKLKTPKRLFNVMSESFGGLTSMLTSESSGIERSRPLSAPRTHFNRRISASRDLALAQLSLSEIKAVKNASGTTVNDVILATCGGALKRYLEMQQDLPEKPLVAMVPISVRKESPQIVTNNQVSGMWSTLATHVNNPLDRLMLIHEDTRDAKKEHDAVGADLLQDWAEFNTPGAFNLAMRVYASTLVDHVNPVHNTIISNVPGPRETLYLCGSRVETMCPVGPILEGVGLNISLASYQDCIGFTLHADSQLIKNVQTIAELIKPAFDELKTLTGTGNPASVPRIRKAGQTQKRPADLVKAS